jgi:hypothetical protein
VVDASGEKLSDWLGRKPTTTLPVVGTTTSPPLSATSGGVCSAHCLPPLDSVNSSQNVFVGSSRWPIGNVAQVPLDAATEVVSGAPSEALAAVVEELALE